MPGFDKERFAQLLERAKGDRSINEYALHSGVSAAYISRLLRGLVETPPGAIVIKKLASRAQGGITAEDLMAAAGYLPDVLAEPPAQYFPSHGVWPVGKMARVPVLGIIRAGLPIYADEQLIGWEELPWEWVKDGEYFLLRVTGDSMIGDNIPPGSLVLVRRQDYIEDGKTAVVMVNSEEATVKKVRFRDGMVLLYPANPKYEPQVYPATEVKIIGKVVKTVIDKE